MGCHLRRKVFEFAVSHEPHNPKVGGSNPPPATNSINHLAGFPDFHLGQIRVTNSLYCTEVVIVGQSAHRSFSGFQPSSSAAASQIRPNVVAVPVSPQFAEHRKSLADRHNSPPIEASVTESNERLPAWPIFLGSALRAEDYGESHTLDFAISHRS